MEYYISLIAISVKKKTGYNDIDANLSGPISVKKDINCEVAKIC